MSAAIRKKRPRSGPRSVASEPRTSDEAVRRATGRGRDDWFALFDAWGAAARAHGEIAAWIRTEHGVDDWWAQTLTVDYEHARGLRPHGGARDGTFVVNATKTIAAPVARMFEAFVNARVQRRWLGSTMRLRTSRLGRSARFDWEDGATRVNVWFVAKGPAKGVVALSHERLPDAKTAKAMRAWWRERMEALGAMLEKPPRKA